MHWPVLRRILLPFAAAVPLMALMAGAALANPPLSQVTVYNEDGSQAGATVCEFYMVFGAVAGGESGVWAIQTQSGSVVRSGDYSVTATQSDREPSVGDISLADGTYVLLWDNESTIDASRGQLSITVACAATSPSPSPSIAPSEAPSTAPSVAPSASVEASETPPSPSPSEITTGGGENASSASPTGEVEGITSTQPTPPPTDTGTAGGGPTPALAALLVLLAISALAALSLPVARGSIQRR